MSQDENIISGNMITAARGLLGISQEELARAVGISAVALNRIENGKARPRPQTDAAIRAALEARGISFATGDRQCVCLDRSKAAIPT